MAKNDAEKFAEAVGAVFLGIFGGVALGAILEAIAKPRCPVCRNKIEKGTTICPHCSAWLQWSA